ncbi:MAG: hypothetical protein ABR576_13240 [Thermoanaerobaculia bacterium]
MTFFRQAALLLPSAFLLAVLLFLLTHGRSDPGFGVYPFFEAWVGSALAATFPEGRFVEQALLFFLPLYLVTLLFLLCISLAESAIFGPRPRGPRSAYGRALGKIFVLVYLPATLVLMVAGDRLATLYAPGALVAPLLAALAPFLAAPAALLPAAVVAIPVAALGKAVSA